MSDNNINPEEKSPLDDDSADKKNQQSSSESNSKDFPDNPNEETDLPLQDKPEPEKEELRIPKTQPVSKPKVSNYQISLIDENLLKVNIHTKQGVKIISSVKDRKTTVETQNNEIYLYPKFNFAEQEISVSISIEDEIIEKTEESPVSEDVISGVTESPKKSNYQINLINENLLNIKIETSKGIRIDSSSKEKFSLKDSQTNKIYLQPKSNLEVQSVEIIIEIDTPTPDSLKKGDDYNVKLIPNPEVVDLIQPPSYPFSDSEDYSDLTSGYKNPFDALRKLIQKNTTIGIITAVVLHSAAAGIVYNNLSKKSKTQSTEDNSRLIVIQDLPDPKIKLQDVEDPNKPKPEDLPTIEDPNKKPEPEREIKPQRTVKPPTVKRPETEEDKNDSDTLARSNLTRELDSLRRLVDSIDFVSDTTKTDSISMTYEIPDSLRNNFNENDIGLAMYFPKNWKLTDQREINKSEKEFKGVLLTDTTAEQPGTMTMFIYLDKENKDYNAEDFKTEFKVNDSTISAFSKEPKTIAGFTEYKFYLFNKLGTEKLSIGASVRKQFFEQYKNEIESVVRSIKIIKKENLEMNSENK